MAIFLEFFGLRNNLTLQEPLYTRNITPILYTERNKKKSFFKQVQLASLQVELGKANSNKASFWQIDLHLRATLQSMEGPQ